MKYVTWTLWHCSIVSRCSWVQLGHVWYVTCSALVSRIISSVTFIFLQFVSLWALLCTFPLATCSFSKAGEMVFVLFFVCVFLVSSPCLGWFYIFFFYNATAHNPQRATFFTIISLKKKKLQLYCSSGVSPMGNSGCLPWGKPAATELRYPTDSACLVF